MPVTLRRFTLDEIASFPEDDGNRYELMDGVLFVTPAPGLPHQAVATELASILRNHIRRADGVFVAAPGRLEVAPGLRLEPDILVGRWPSTDREWSSVREHYLAVEVSGARSRVYDREYKRDGYLDLGVREVWLVDLTTQRILVSRPGEQKDVPHDGTVTWHSPVAPPALQLDVAALFSVIPG